MPTHDTYREQLLDLAYGELGRGEARALRAHLESCPACRAELERIGATRGAMAELRDEPAPDRGLPSLLAAAREAARGRAPKPLLPSWLWGASVAAVGLAAVAIVSLKLSGTGPIPAGRTGEVDLVAHAPAPEAAPGPRAPAALPAAEPPAKLEESAPATADRRAPAAKLAAPKPSKGLAAPLAPQEAAKEAKAAPAPRTEAERAAGGVRDDAAEPAGNAAVAPAPAGAGPARGAPSGAEAQQPRLAAAPSASRAEGAVASEAATSTLRRAKSAPAVRLRTSTASFTGCPGESWREVDRDEQGRVVRYLRRGVFRGTAFEAELLYGDDGALSEVRYRADGQVHTLHPGAAGAAADADAGGVPAALLEPRRAEDAGPDAPPRCGG